MTASLQSLHTYTHCQQQDRVVATQSIDRGHQGSPANPASPALPRLSQHGRSLSTQSTLLRLVIIACGTTPARPISRSPRRFSSSPSSPRDSTPRKLLICWREKHRNEGARLAIWSYDGSSGEIPCRVRSARILSAALLCEHVIAGRHFLLERIPRTRIYKSEREIPWRMRLLLQTQNPRQDPARPKPTKVCQQHRNEPMCARAASNADFQRSRHRTTTMSARPRSSGL